jgi:hypothetical protein
MKWKDFARERSEPVFRYYPGIFFEGLRKNVINITVASLGAEIRTRDFPNTK